MDGMDARGNPDADAAERRLAEALRAQASLTARGGSPKAPPVKGRPATTPGPSGSPSPPPAKTTQKTPKQTAGPGQSGPQPGRRPVGPHTRSVHGTGPGHGSGGQRARERGDGPPPAAVTMVDTALAAAPTAQQPVHTMSRASGAKPAGPHRAGATRGTQVGGSPSAAGPAAVRTPAPAGPDRTPAAVRPASLRLRWMLVAGLLAGALLGCLLAVLSVLDTGLLPALG